MKRPRLTDRQSREVEYFKEYAERYQDMPIDLPHGFFDIVEERNRRWWDPDWTMYSILLQRNIRNKRTLVVGCGSGTDAFRLWKMGAEVYAFDLSSDMMVRARKIAKRERARIRFDVMPAEELEYEDDFFDCVVASVVLHHCDIPRSFREIRRVSKAGATVVINEPYSHSAIQKVRHSRFVEDVIYPRMARLVLKKKTQAVSEDERKLTHQEIEYILRDLRCARVHYFKFLYNRLFPASLVGPTKMDRVFLNMCRPIARFVAGRVVVEGQVDKA